jgi:threonyl-tRNA synthetase
MGYKIYKKDEAYYSHKINCKVLYAFGKEHQLTTIQLYFNLHERFNLVYKDLSCDDIM